jgi:CoA:oxalate CoA-transferase
MKMKSIEKQALEDVRVLDFTAMLAGPFASMMFADYGAEVIKIEPVGKGDYTRNIGPFANQDSEKKAGGYFLSISRNKKSMAINLKHPKGIEIIKELTKKSDIVIENFRPGVMDRLGLGYDSLREVNPKIVYTSISGFGHSGPYKKRPAFDLVAQAMGGVMSITGPKGGPPYKFGPGIGDIWASTIAAYASMVALHCAKETGEGQHVDCAMYDTMIYMMERAIMMYSMAGIVSGCEGNSHPLYAPYDCFESKDGKYVVIAGHWDKQWENLCRAMEREDLLENPKLKTMGDRAQNYNYLRPIIENWTKSRDRNDVVDFLIQEDVPVGPVNTVEDIFNCEHVKARDMLVEINHPIAGKFKIVNAPAKFSKTPGAVQKAAPTLGQHTEEILKMYLGYSDETIQSLRDEKTI